ncbi:molybdenum cofactor sulfurase [Rosa chinensis]|uniref:molybdenum cofactor sulfurase n=1 Tax=Rosa chinensis TaxID=74649 RepID=UPI000D097E50|nr:molybdenum cofactor sulfurase [Rosa chinensis]
MQSPCLKEVTEVCLSGCCSSRSSPLFKSTASHDTASKSGSTSAACRRDFAAKTSSSIFPNTQFTNHESIPSLQKSFSDFTRAYPRYYETAEVDQIRAQEYYHLTQSNHTCLDYIGIGLFSSSQLHKQESSKQKVPSTSTSRLPSPPQNSDYPFFSISYKTGNLKTELLHGGHESELESAMRRRIMRFLNISENDYSMVFTANRTSAFKLVAESYPYKTSRKLLSVYDYESEAVESMINSSEKRGAQVMSAEFSWPRLRIQSEKLRKMIGSKKKKKKKRGVFVFPVHSRVTGSRYPYIWMTIAQENGWHVLVDACALGPKDMDSFGLSLFQPDFLISSFYKVYGENPSGFACLFVKKSAIPVLEASTSTGIVNLVPAQEFLQIGGDSSDTEVEEISRLRLQEDILDISRSFSGLISNHSHRGTPTKRLEQGELSDSAEDGANSEELEISGESERLAKSSKNGNQEVVCRSLDQVDSLGLILITNRARYLINWLVSSLRKLKHPNSEGVPLVRIYGPKIKYDRGPALAFNVFDWKGEKVEPVLVQKLADRNNISLSYGFLHHIWFSDKYAEERGRVLERRDSGAKGMAANKLKAKSGSGISVVTAALGFVSNFEDIYRLWAFVAQFLDADFVEKERWRYTALNQKTIEV